MGLLRRKSTAERLFDLPPETEIAYAGEPNWGIFLATKQAAHDYSHGTFDLEPVTTTLQASLSSVRSLHKKSSLSVVLASPAEGSTIRKYSRSRVIGYAAGILLQSDKRTSSYAEQKQFAIDSAHDGLREARYALHDVRGEERDYTDFIALNVARDILRLISPDVLDVTEVDRLMRNIDK